jgi:hypothetical protein
MVISKRILKSHIISRVFHASRRHKSPVGASGGPLGIHLKKIEHNARAAGTRAPVPQLN